MLQNKKGAALLQVLLVTVVLAGMAAMLLRAALSRTTAARQTRRSVSGQMLVNSCMSEVNSIWTIKGPEVFARDISQCIMYCKDNTSLTADCPAANIVRSHECKVTQNGINYSVIAEFETSGGVPVLDADGKCKLVYTIQDADKI